MWYAYTSIRVVEENVQEYKSLCLVWVYWHESIGGICSCMWLCFVVLGVRGCYLLTSGRVYRDTSRSEINSSFGHSSLQTITGAAYSGLFCFYLFLPLSGWFYGEKNNPPSQIHNSSLRSYSYDAIGYSSLREVITPWEWWTNAFVWIRLGFRSRGSCFNFHPSTSTQVNEFQPRLCKHVARFPDS